MALTQSPMGKQYTALSPAATTLVTPKILVVVGGMEAGCRHFQQGAKDGVLDLSWTSVGPMKTRGNHSRTRVSRCCITITRIRVASDRRGLPTGGWDKVGGRGVKGGRGEGEGRVKGVVG